MNELEKMVWAAAFAQALPTVTAAGRRNPVQVALAEAAYAVDKLRRYRIENPTSNWLPDELIGRAS